jgi:hypothetical protein
LPSPLQIQPFELLQRRDRPMTRKSVEILDQ